MASHDMPLLLDGDAMNVDSGMQGIRGMQSMESAMALDEVDLFGDPVMNNALAGLPARPPTSRPLQQRLDELRTRGCCQGIAWSRQGTIAAISKDGMSISLRFIRCSPDDGDWAMSDPSPSSTVSQGPSPAPHPSSSSGLSLASAGAPFVHLAWAPTTTPDLAVIDALGRLTILTFSITLNRGYLARRWDADPVDDLHAIVGCYWLPLGVHPSRQASDASPCLPASSTLGPLFLRCAYCRSTVSTDPPSGCSPSTGTSRGCIRLPARGTPILARVPCYASPPTACSSSSFRKITTASKRRPSSSRA